MAVASREYFGFSLYVGATVFLLAYTLWAALPKRCLAAMSVVYYPSRWWAVAFPAFVLVLMMYIYVALACYNTERLAFPVNSFETITDPVAKIETDSYFLHAHADAVRDLPISSVNQVLYGVD